MKLFTVILFSFGIIIQPVSSQDLNGYWKGTLTMRGCFPENNIELQIFQKGNKTIGDSYHYQDINNYVKKKFSGKYDPSSRQLTISEGIVTTYHIPQRCVICIKDFDLVYHRNGNVEILSGEWSGKVLNSMLGCEGGKITLTRIAESAFKAVPEIKVDTGTIRLDFYDNAQIDGDTISVLVDSRVVLSRQCLSAKPLTTYIKIDLDNTFHEVEMIAENLGSIPPNTAILVVTAGVKRYLLHLTASDGKSAMVRFVYDKDWLTEDQTVAGAH